MKIENVNKIYNMYVVIRKPSLQEDEGRFHTLGFFNSRKESEEFINLYLQNYWHKDEFIISVPIDQQNKCG